MNFVIKIGHRKKAEPTNDDSNPNYGYIISGTNVKVIDGEEVPVEDDFGLPKSVNRQIIKGKKVPCGQCGRTDYVDIRGRCCDKCMTKAETFPFRLYDDQRKDVIKLVKKTSTLDPTNIALRPVDDGFVGVFYDDDNLARPFLFALTSSKGVKIKAAKNLDGAMDVHQSLMDEEGRISLQAQRKETARTLEEFAGRLAKAFPVNKEQKVKQAKPAPNAGKQIAGSGGKVRYNYADQGKEKNQPGKKSPARPVPPEGVEQVPDVKPTVDPKKLAELLRTTPEVLRKLAVKFETKGGREKFVSYFKKRFGEFLKKHSLTTQYLRMLFEALTGEEQ